MPVLKPHIKEPGLYFITFTNYKWLPLIELANGYDLVYKWFDELTKNGHEIAGYVIMPKSYTCIDRLQQSLNTIVGNGKRLLPMAL